MANLDPCLFKQRENVALLPRQPLLKMVVEWRQGMVAKRRNEAFLTFRDRLADAGRQQRVRDSSRARCSAARF